MPEPKKVVLLGATGSIGTSTLQVLRAHPDRLQLVGVASRTRHQELAAICHEFGVEHAVITNERAYQAARELSHFPATTQLACGHEALTELATLADADIVLVAVVGACGLKPALAAIEAGKDIALANKELLVLGGAFVIEAARRKGIRLLPTDSEHNAIFQCIEGHPQEHLHQLILTASGGQFRETPIADLSTVTPTQATQHPNWSMGPKITVDSATMANKGLELIEAHWLFGLPAEKLQVTIHPQSIAHSFVQFVDGSILGQFSPPSMTFAIQHCLLYPDRAPGVHQTLDFAEAMQWDFRSPDFARYPCLQLAYDALRAGNCAPAIFNAANEIAVERFLNGEIRYLDIPAVIDNALQSIPSMTPSTIDDLFAIDQQTREHAHDFKPHN
ncbi:1-deoxy-D-xylulose-5-phosphate reductoisomerase [Coraliomargarita akajimensis]|uniref:1-deoxy-D-xylulose 5-phosphate reductoisomerase n=1 Tax=Coraliomargarita akajimensis (strain DSM 45221 / IAM 15411 / JCM 23193 / KCTC 12865 / 04OKA010-24) TaxID=583355 RepID=D5EHX3_CORAD|nr:1-deoxy-D-xylulose-5-phosphate reductoisomerase [Coraliomargarita akajimensis]ADE56013.1 1-deoxy-D-xylulose 5-phosphate reductoisomerase [Coraliomargarita akajimensis DSM 45221]